MKTNAERVKHFTEELEKLSTKTGLRIKIESRFVLQDEINPDKADKESAKSPDGIKGKVVKK